MGFNLFRLQRNNAAAGGAKRLEDTLHANTEVKAAFDRIMETLSAKDPATTVDVKKQQLHDSLIQFQQSASKLPENLQQIALLKLQGVIQRINPHQFNSGVVMDLGSVGELANNPPKLFGLINNANNAPMQTTHISFNVNS